ncbi:hypothetical protein ACHHYP_06678, partial [Achlya hypogyna]
MAVKATLLGATSPTHNASTYDSALVALWLTDVVANKSTVVASPTKRMYIDYAAGDSSGYTVSPESCAIPAPGDSIYAERYLAKLLPHIASAAPSLDVLLHTDVVVDCSFKGRQVQDTSALKLHFLNRNESQLWTLFLQTLQLTRPSKRLTTACGMASISMINLSAVSANSAGTLSTSQTAAYTHVIGVEFPYVLAPFHLVEIPDPSKLTSDGRRHATIVESGESIELAGIEGIYRSALDIQASYNYCIWDLP